jgi:hypothetical protein
MHVSRLGAGLKLRRGGSRAPVFATVHQQPFPPLHFCGIDDLPSVASEAQTNERLTGQGLDYRTIGV